MSLQELTQTWLDGHRPELVDLVRELVALPSENRPPGGHEGPCQARVADYLGQLGAEVDVFRPDEVEGAAEHEQWWPGRNYDGRPCVVGRMPGGGGRGRSLLLSGHTDVVPALGEGRHGHWDGDVEDGRVYGRGSWDMKGGVACALHAARCLHECGVRLAGDLLVETVVDEEFGGANGTLASRLRGYVADGAVLSEPTGMAVCHATRGGIQYRLRATGGATGMGFEGGPGTSALVALARVAAALDAAPRPAPLLQYLLRSGEELPWGTGEGLPAEGMLEFWAEITPGTDREGLDTELRGIVAEALPTGIELDWEQTTRFLPAADIGPNAEIVRALRRALGRPDAPAEVAPFACDAFMFAAGATPVAVCGPGGGNAHAPDEYVLVDDLHALAAGFTRLALDWCGAAP